MGAILAIVERHESLLLGLAALSFAMFLFGLLALPGIVILLPENIFLRYSREGRLLPQKTPFRPVYRVFKNILGYIFIFSGFLLLFLPGQGLMMIFIGILLADFPGKHDLVERLLEEKHLQRSLNWIRRKAGRRLFLFPHKQHRSPGPWI